ncbi:MAG: hypothetical protein GY801_14675 [bacterium]|nr:hypothetical protein [bacterium]
MEAIRKIQTVREGQVSVRLPAQFWNQQVEIIILSVSRQHDDIPSKKSLRGCLHQYANPTLIDHEQEAWHDAVREKYGHR